MGVDHWIVLVAAAIGAAAAVVAALVQAVGAIVAAWIGRKRDR